MIIGSFGEELSNYHWKILSLKKVYYIRNWNKSARVILTEQSNLEWKQNTKYSLTRFRMLWKTIRTMSSGIPHNRRFCKLASRGPRERKVINVTAVPHTILVIQADAGLHKPTWELVCFQGKTDARNDWRMDERRRNCLQGWSIQLQWTKRLWIPPRLKQTSKEKDPSVAPLC